MINCSKKIIYVIYRPDATWHVPIISIIFGILGTGNLLTTSTIIPLKIRESKLGLLKFRFVSLLLALLGFFASRLVNN